MDQTSAESLAQVADIASRLEAAFNARDAAALASLYADSAILMPPNEPMVTGRAAIRSWFERALPRLGRVSIMAVESGGEGDRAFQIGTFTTAALSDGSAPSSTRSGKYVLLLNHNAGQWRIQCDIWNLDQPVG
jgi:uncharacterized protein (TIGR02246 family)